MPQAEEMGEVEYAAGSLDDSAPVGSAGGFARQRK